MRWLTLDRLHHLSKQELTTFSSLVRCLKSSSVALIVFATSAYSSKIEDEYVDLNILESRIR